MGVLDLEYGEDAALDLMDGELLPSGALDDAVPDEQRLHEATGNEGVSLERAYRHAAFVLWPRSRTLAILAGADIGGAIAWLAGERDRNAGVANARIRRIAIATASTSATRPSAGVARTPSCTPRTARVIGGDPPSTPRMFPGCADWSAPRRATARPPTARRFSRDRTRRWPHPGANEPKPCTSLPGGTGMRPLSRSWLVGRARNSTGSTRHMTWTRNRSRDTRHSMEPS